MTDIAKIQTLHDNTTGDAVAPRTVVSALSGTGEEGQLVGFTGKDTVGLITPDAKPMEGSAMPVQSGGVYDEIGKLATKEELGGYATKEESKQHAKSAASRRAAVTYDYGGRNLKDVFVSADALHEALVAEDYTNIAVGDYWPITLNGTFWDYGAYTVKLGAKYYSNNTLETESGTTAATYEGAYVSDTVVSFSMSGTKYYVSISDCIDHFERRCNNIIVKLEVAGINSYFRYGDAGDLTKGIPHILFISRDCIPFWMRMRKGDTKWENTDVNIPWAGSALYKTLNDESNGIIKLVANTDIGEYIYDGPNNKGMKIMMGLKGLNDANANGFNWTDRGKLFLPTESEVFLKNVFTNPKFDNMSPCGIELFENSSRHISKASSDGGTKTGWWLCTSSDGSNKNFTYVNENCTPGSVSSSVNLSFPICFVFA